MVLCKITVTSGRGNLHFPTPPLISYRRLPPWYTFLSLPSLPLSLKSKMVAMTFVKKILSIRSPKLRLLCRLFPGVEGSTCVNHSFWFVYGGRVGLVGLQCNFFLLLFFNAVIQIKKVLGSCYKQQSERTCFKSFNFFSWCPDIWTTSPFFSFSHIFPLWVLPLFNLTVVFNLLDFQSLTSELL